MGVCATCGIEYLTEDQKKRGGAVTFNMGVCEECNETTLVTSTRHYNYLIKPE